jgi:predicted phage terminase large subunit-like protein
VSTQQDIDLDRAIASDGLWSFVQIAWDHVEPRSLVPNWHLRVICDFLTSPNHLHRVVNQPPSTGKSIISGVFWPAWVWTFSPGHSWMYVSFDDDLLNRDAEKLIRLISSPWYVERWGKRLAPGKTPVSNFTTLQGGRRFNTSFGGAGTGWHCHDQVIDDPIKASEAATISGIALETTWRTLSNTFASRALDLKTFRRTIIGQRTHEADPSGRALEAGWVGLRLPMLLEADDPDPLDERTREGESLFPERFSLEAIDRIRRVDLQGDADTWETQYQQRPSAKTGGVYHLDWLRTYDPRAARERCWYTVQSWDLSFKGLETSDFVAGQWWGVGPPLEGEPGAEESEALGEPWFYELDDPVFGRMTFVESLAELRIKRRLWPCSRIFIEDKANGPAAESVLGREMPGLLELVNPKGSKVARATGVAPLLANGRVRFASAPSWEERRLRTYSRFPRVRRDDEIDATSQALAKLSDAGLLQMLGGMK